MPDPPPQSVGSSGDTPKETDVPEAVPARLDYEVLRIIGRGNYGSVWLVRDAAGAYCACKVVYREQFDHDRPYEREYAGIQRFEPVSRANESQVKILHVGRRDEAGYFYYLMELGDDTETGQEIQPERYTPKTLKSELARRGRLPVAECVQIGLCLCEALENLHENGLIHRDVKPANIIFVRGTPKLADIGLLTEAGHTISFVGTIGFIPPEGPTSPQADLYALGKVLYEISTGMDRLDFPELPAGFGALPDREAILDLNAVAARACESDVRRRYQSARGMFADLALLRSGKSLTRARRARCKWELAARAALALPVLLAAAAWIIYGVNKLAQSRAPRSEQLPIAAGPFQPDWQSLSSQYHVPEWFRDAKFGIWACWGCQSEPEAGSWYSRNMYVEGNRVYKLHIEHYGHPSRVGFKDVIHQWQAAHFDPDKLLALYRQCGARYFMALASYHDNFDNFNSKYQPWNSVSVGPRRDLIGLWAAAARKNGLRFAVSVHCSRAWSWYEVAQRADSKGPLAGVPYDGKLTKADGQGQWWQGLDPQDLYAQSHIPGQRLNWAWDPAYGSSTPDEAYRKKFFLRTQQLWDDYRPDMIFFDDFVLPFHGVTDEIGLRLAAHFYNSSVRWHGRNEAVVTGQQLNEEQRKALVYDRGRGDTQAILPEPWQTDTSLGEWDYNREVFEKHQYKSAATVIPMLADIVSKNGNLMLVVSMRRDGTIDEDEMSIVSAIGAWLEVNGEAIYATRPWKVYGEGPSTGASESDQSAGQRDAQKRPFTAQDIRFTQSRNGKALYAIVLAFPAEGTVTLKSLAENSPYWDGEIGSVLMLGVSGELKHVRDANGLTVTLPNKRPCDIAFALKITGG